MDFDLKRDIQKLMADTEKFKRTLIRRGELDRLEIDWGRFSKTVGQIQKHLEGVDIAAHHG